MIAPIIFTVAGRPQTKGSGRGIPFIRRHGPKAGRLGVRVTNDNPKTASWENQVRHEAQQVRPRPGPWSECPVRLRVVFGLVKPKSWAKTQPDWPYRRPDLDKLLRVIQDAMTGVIYVDDAQVCMIATEKVFTASPGVQVEVRPL